MWTLVSSLNLYLALETDESDAVDEPYDSSSSDDQEIISHPSEIPLDDLKLLVRSLDMIKVRLRGYNQVSPLVFWLQGFGRGNPPHYYFKNMSVNNLWLYADSSTPKIHAALEILQSDAPDREERARVAVQKYHADDMIKSVLDALRDQTPEEEDTRVASRQIQQWLKWQRSAVRLDNLPPGGPLGQEPLKLDKMIHDRLQEEESATFRHRYEVHARTRQSTPTVGDLIWFPGGSVTTPVKPLWYLSNKEGLNVRLPATTRVWHAAEDSTKLTRRMPDYPMLFTPEQDGDGMMYFDQSRHRRGAVAVPKPTPPVPVFDWKSDTWRSRVVQPRSPPSPAPGIAAPSTYPPSFKEELKKMRQTGPPHHSPPPRHVHDVWGLPPSGSKKRKPDHMALESSDSSSDTSPDPKRIKRGKTPPPREDPSVTHEADPSDPNWNPPSPKSGPGAPRSVPIMSPGEQDTAKMDALFNMHRWNFPQKNLTNANPMSYEQYSSLGQQALLELSSSFFDAPEEDEEDEDDDGPGNLDSSSQPQDPTSENDEDTPKDPGSKYSGGCHDPAVLPANSRPDDDDDASKDPGKGQQSGSLLTQPGSGRLGLRGLLHLFRYL